MPAKTGVYIARGARRALRYTIAMPHRTYDDFAGVIAQYQTPPTPEMLHDLITTTIAIDADGVDEPMISFARSRIELAYRSGDVEMHLRHLYEVLTVLEREAADD